MPTNSITKEFIVNDFNAYLKLVEELDNHKSSLNKNLLKNNSHLKGKRLLKEFKFN